MKRAAVKLKQFNALDVQANAKIKHQTLLNEYLELQKDFVSKKRKFQAAKQKRDSLLAIVKFLGRKRQFLLKCQTSTSESERNLVDWENVVRERSKLEKEIKHAAHEAAVRHEEGGRRIAQHEQVVREESRSEKVQEELTC